VVDAVRFTKHGIVREDLVHDGTATDVIALVEDVVKIADKQGGYIRPACLQRAFKMRLNDCGVSAAGRCCPIDRYGGKLGPGNDLAQVR